MSDVVTGILTSTELRDDQRVEALLANRAQVAGPWFDAAA